MGFDPRLLDLARKAADAEGLDPAVVCAVVEQESAWNTWAMRYEPLFFAKYVAPLYTNNKVGATEAYARGFSWGLMQVTIRPSASRLAAKSFGRSWTRPEANSEKLCNRGTAAAIPTTPRKW